MDAWDRRSSATGTAGSRDRTRPGHAGAAPRSLTPCCCCCCRSRPTRWRRRACPCGCCCRRRAYRARRALRRDTSSEGGGTSGAQLRATQSHFRREDCRARHHIRPYRVHGPLPRRRATLRSARHSLHSSSTHSTQGVHTRGASPPREPHRRPQASRRRLPPPEQDGGLRQRRLDAALDAAGPVSRTLLSEVALADETRLPRAPTSTPCLCVALPQRRPPPSALPPQA